MFVVYTKIHRGSDIEYWYYGCYNDEDRANEIAIELGGVYPLYHCVCEVNEPIMKAIQNLPSDLQKIADEI